MREGKRTQTEDLSRSKVLGAGVLAGLVSALLMTLLLLFLRSQFGVPTPSELVGDRMAPTISVDTFIKLIVQAGGFNTLKQIGFGSVIIGQVVVGTLGGLLYALIVNRNAVRKSAQKTSLRISKAGLALAISFVAALWLLSLLLLWPVLGTHYHGLPGGRATLVTAFSLLVVYAVYGPSLIVCYGIIIHPAAQVGPSTSRAQHSSRRAILVGGAGVAIAGTAGLIMRRLYRIATFSYDGTQYLGDDVQFVTPNQRFYVVTKNVIDPQVNRDLWRLEIAGMVERPRAYTFTELSSLPAVSQETTLMCISNQVGGGLMSNAVWKGVPLRSLVGDAGPQAGITKAVFHAVDSYSDTIPFAKAMEPTTLIAYEMNGAPLPFNHGYPVRAIVPGLFGEKSVKWITRIELLAKDVKGFYERQGWGPDFVIPTHSRFDGPDFRRPIPPGAMVPLKGVAFAGNRGISRVEVSLDDGKRWQEAKINMPGTRLTWALWNYDWKPEQPGEYRLVVRATDGDGALQIAEERWTAPHGATGYHKVTARIVA
jgi:DMSO/TMAO reductase YedYZ molybdopterin-dependent catalytic subunit